jgi:hypothetical protein
MIGWVSLRFSGSSSYAYFWGWTGTVCRLRCIQNSRYEIADTWFSSGRDVVYITGMYNLYLVSAV